MDNFFVIVGWVKLFGGGFMSFKFGYNVVGNWI